ncbi:unnamed protein product [Umbelopsis ramanniana]
MAKSRHSKTTTRSKGGKPNRANGVRKAGKPNKKKSEDDSKKTKFDDMSVEDFFQGGFEEHSDAGDESENDDFAALETVETEAADSDAENEVDDDEMDQMDDDAAELDDEALFEEDEEKPNEKKKGKKGALKEDISKHKEELEQLREQDPEFYEFLQKEESGLLDFDVSDEDLEDESEPEDEVMEGGEGQEEEEQEPSQFSDEEDGVGLDEPMTGAMSHADAQVVTKEMIEEWASALEMRKSVKTLKHLLSAFKCAARMNDEDDENTSYTYKVTSGTVFNKLILTTLRLVPVCFNYNLTPNKEGASPVTAKKWNILKGMVKSYCSNVLHLLRGLTDSTMVYYILKETEKCTKYFGCFSRITREYLNSLLQLWSGPTSSDIVRIQSFLNIRSLALAPIVTKQSKNGSYLDECLKGVYLSFVRNSKNTSVHTLPSINLMRNLAVELYGLNQELSYQHAFTFVRQLAIHLRGALQNTTTESFKTVYNWQYVHCIDFWANVFATYCNTERADYEESPLASMIYPLTQVAIGAIRLIPTAQYYPLRFHIIRALTSLADSTKVFIPLAPYIFEVFESAEIKKKGKPASLKPMEWDVYIRAPKQFLHTKVYQHGILEQLYECLIEYYATFSLSIDFPEMAGPGIVQLKRYIKKSSYVNFNKQVHGLIEKMEATANFIQEQRALVDYSPADVDSVKGFLKDLKPISTPLGKFLINHRKIKAQKQALLESAREQEQKQDS